MFECSYCPFTFKRKWNMKINNGSKHENKAPTTISVGSEGGRAPTTYRESGPDVGPAPTSIQFQHPHIDFNAYQPSNQAQVKQNGHGIQSDAHQALTSHCASGPEIGTASYQDPAQGVHPQSHHTDGDYPTSNQVGCGLIDTNPALPSKM